MRAIGSPARTMAINGALLYGGGAMLVTVFLVLPHAPSTNLAGMLFAGGMAWLVTILLVVGRDWLPAVVFPALTVAGTTLIAVLALSDGSRPSAFALLFVWATVYSFYFYSLPLAILEAAWVALASGLVSLLAGGSGDIGFFRWLMIVATSVMAGIAVRQLVVQVRALADRDAVTGVFSRRKFHEEIERDMSRARRSGEPLSLALLDLDHFKQLNDRDGHVQGDRHLRATAQGWQRLLRTGDTLARYGGEEFVAILPNAALERARDAADRLRGAVPAGETASAGVAQWDGRESSTALVARADRALYEAKAAGRNATMASLASATA